MEETHIINFSSDNMVDRIAETEIILSELENKTTDIIILYSHTGIGKSALANRILKQCIHFAPIKVKASPENVSESVTEGFFLTKIFNSFVHFFQKNKCDYPKCSLFSYLCNSENSKTKSEVTEQLLNNINMNNFLRTFSLSLSKTVISRIMKLNEYNPNSKIFLETKEDMIFASDYIKFVLSETPVLVNIDNIQNIDQYSYCLLLDWISDCARKSIFLLEYTISETYNTDKLARFVNKFTELDLDTKLIEICGLKSENALQALKKMYGNQEDSEQFFQKAKLYYIYQSNGSMQKLIDYTLQYKSNSPLKDCYDPTMERIHLLNNYEKFILAIIILHGGEIDSSLLKELAEHSVNPVIINYEKIILQLKTEAFLILEDENVISLTHASITDSWNNNQKLLEKYTLLAFDLCDEYYTWLLEIGQDHKNIEQPLLFLLRIYSRYNHSKLGYLISNIDGLVSEKITANHVWEYYLLFLEYISGNEDIYRSSLYNMVEFCFNHGLYRECLYVIQILEKNACLDDEEYLFVYKINCYEYLEIKDAIKLCEERLNQPLNIDQKYNCYLLLMGRYRSANQPDMVMKYVKKIQNLPDYKNMFQYGTFLRLSEIYMSRHEALPYVRESVTFFNNRNEKIMEARARLTYFFLLALTSDLSLAYDELNHCKRLVNSVHYWDGILALNEGSILLLQEKYGKKADYLLRKAELSINSPFDMLLTLTMLMINEYETLQKEVNKTLLKRIEKLLLNESDKHLICLVAYDLYLYFSKTGDAKQAQKYRQIAENTMEYNVSISYKMKGDINPYTPNLFETDWGIGFTFFWNVDVPKPNPL